MSVHSCPYCQCGRCGTHSTTKTDYPNVNNTPLNQDPGEVTYVHSDGTRVRDGKVVGHQSQVDPNWNSSEQTIWEKGQPNYPGSYEGSQVISHVTRSPNTSPNGIGSAQTKYFIDPAFEQTYQHDNSQQWERMPTNSPLSEEMQRQVNQQFHSLAENLKQRYGADSVQVHQAFLVPPGQIQNPKPNWNEPEYDEELESHWDEAPQTPNKNSKKRDRSPQKTGLTPKQKREIIDICKRNKQQEEIGGLILADGTITQETNLARNKRSTFQFKWNGKPAIGIWHRHLKKLNHDPKLSPDDIRAAKESGLSMYMVYDIGELNADYSQYKWDEYHPNGTPNAKPIRNYQIQFVCPTGQQYLEEIDRFNRYIKEENEDYARKVEITRKRVAQKQAEVQSKVNGAVAAIQDAETRVELLQNKYQMAARNYQRLPGVKQFLLPEGKGNAVCHTVVQKPEVLRVQN